MDGNAVYALTVTILSVFAGIFILYVVSVSPGTGGHTRFIDAPKCKGCGAPMTIIDHKPDFDMEAYGEYLVERNGLSDGYKWDFTLCGFCNSSASNNNETLERRRALGAMAAMFRDVR